MDQNVQWKLLSVMLLLTVFTVTPLAVSVGGTVQHRAWGLIRLRFDSGYSITGVYWQWWKWIQPKTSLLHSCSPTCVMLVNSTAVNKSHITSHKSVWIIISSFSWSCSNGKREWTGKRLEIDLPGYFSLRWSIDAGEVRSGSNRALTHCCLHNQLLRLQVWSKVAQRWVPLINTRSNL